MFLDAIFKQPFLGFKQLLKNISNCCSLSSFWSPKEDKICKHSAYTAFMWCTMEVSLLLCHGFPHIVFINVSWENNFKKLRRHQCKKMSWQSRPCLKYMWTVSLICPTHMCLTLFFGIEKTQVVKLKTVLLRKSRWNVCSLFWVLGFYSASFPVVLLL